MRQEPFIANPSESSMIFFKFQIIRSKVIRLLEIAVIATLIVTNISAANNDRGKIMSEGLTPSRIIPARSISSTN